MNAFFYHQDILDLRNFKAERIDDDTLGKIIQASKKIRKDILSMINLAGSGHIGGSLSSADIFLMLWLCADVSSVNYGRYRDRIVVSHGHTSSALYAVLGNLGFFDVQQAIGNYRKAGGIFEGHPNVHIPGVEWGSGSLGQGLSVGCGFALAAKLQKQNNRVFVIMGDGEQQKGQLTEAREFAAKHRLSNLIGIIDYNQLQASGNTAEVMPCDIQRKYESSGWEIISIEGHNFQEIYRALKYAYTIKEKPVAILAHTVMGKGVPFIENNFEYHGRVLNETQYKQAIAGLEIPEWKKMPSPVIIEEKNNPVEGRIRIGKPICYEPGMYIECRTAAGAAIYSLIKENPDIPIAVLDADLRESLKTEKISKDFPDRFVECGIQEHNAVTVTGALSKVGVLSFFPSFGVFGIDETYGQNRMNDMNGTSVKLINTHCGLDVGEDGKTHQCIDYISLINNLPNHKLIISADANQTDRAIRYIASNPGNFVLAMGRSKIAVLQNRNGKAFYCKDYVFSYGNPEWIREGTDAAIITTGTLVHMAVKATDILLEENIHVGVLNVSCPKEISPEIIKNACNTGVLITYEDHLVQSGLGSIVASIIAENGLKCHFKKIGITKYGISCSAEEQYKYQGLDVEGLLRTVRMSIKIKT